MGSFQCKSSAVGYTKAQAEYANLIVWQNPELQMTRNVLRLKKPSITVDKNICLQNATNFRKKIHFRNQNQ